MASADVETGLVISFLYRFILLIPIFQAIADAASDPYIKCQLYELSSNIASSIIMFLDAMDTPDYLPEVLQVLDVLAASCRTTFSEKFQVRTTV